jgi:hypothetical protein
MFKLSKKINNLSQKKATFLAVGLVLAILLPFLAFSGESNKIYVDDDASGEQTGSSSHPYKTIGAAMKKADDDTEIHIRKGTYKENVEIKKGVEIYGAGADKVTIKAKEDGDAVVVMNNKTKINEVTIRGGKNGIWVEKKGGASIIDCVIKENRKNGIEVESGEVDKSRAVYIDGNTIKDNGKNGIYSGKRRLSITKNEIYENDGDGIILEAGTSAWIGNNTIKDNDYSGMKLTIDGSKIWTKRNTIRYNGREGIEVNFYGGAGRIDINKSKTVINDRHGLARVQRKPVANSTNLWGQYLTYGDSEFWGNKIKDITPILHIY